jgi:hypothetical protein
MTTICNHSVVLFGGYSNKHISPFSDTWIFDGEKEEWQELKPVSQIKPRYYHSAVAMYQELSPCKCKESVVVYGGIGKYLNCYDDIWELRCVNNSAAEKVYQWFSLQGNGTTSNPSPSSRGFQTVFSSRQLKSMYLWGGISCSALLDTYQGNWPNSTVLYDLWRYDFTLNSWNLVASNTYSYDMSRGRHRVTNRDFSPAVTFQVNNKEKGVVVSGRLTRVVDFQSGSITSPFINRRENVPDIASVGASVVVMGGQIVVFGGSQATVGNNTISDLYPTVWNLSYNNINDQWNWFANPCPISSPRGRLLLQANVHLVENKIFIVGGFVFEDPFSLLVSLNGGDHESVSFSDVWEFDLLDRRWWRSWSSYAPKSLIMMASAVVDRKLIFFGGSVEYTPQPLESFSSSMAFMTPLNFNMTALNTTWGYHTHTRRWTLYKVDVHTWPSSRVGASLVSVGNGSLLLFGGLSDNSQPLNDLWCLTLCRNHDEISGESESCAQWVKLGNGEIKPRYYHAAAVLGSRFMTIVGGYFKFSYCLHDMWLYDLQTGHWSMQNALGLPRPLLNTCRYLMTSIGTKLIVLYQNGTVDQGSFLVDGVTGGITYTYDKATKVRWIAQAGSPSFGVAAMVSWRNYILALGLPSPRMDANDDDDDRLILSLFMPGCAAGHKSSSWRSKSCSKCPIGSYSNKGSSHCTPCPDDLKTTASGSTSLKDCLCAKGYCSGHGTCYVSSPNKSYQSDMKPYCVCDNGYSGPVCEYPFLYVIVGTMIASTIVLLLIGLLLVKCLRYKKGKLVAEKEMESMKEAMKKVWSIGAEELYPETGHVGEGGFGEVSKARYREMTVAVKKLHKDLICFIEEERAFAREVESMQSIRHPNIVLFLGAGKFADGCPFIVLEYVSNGSVRDILDNEAIAIDDGRRIMIALHTARGMMFLHDLKPPRIHRDLKSPNLLVTQDWVVKVADFGTSRLIQAKESTSNLMNSIGTIGKRKRRFRKSEDNVELGTNSEQDMALPLLSENVGTRLWQAPETIGHQTRYGLPADVYR